MIKVENVLWNDVTLALNCSALRTVLYDEANNHNASGSSQATAQWIIDVGMEGRLLSSQILFCHFPWNKASDFCQSETSNTSRDHGRCGVNIAEGSNPLTRLEISSIKNNHPIKQVWNCFQLESGVWFLTFHVSSFLREEDFYYRKIMMLYDIIYEAVFNVSLPTW